MERDKGRAGSCGRSFRVRTPTRTGNSYSQELADQMATLLLDVGRRFAAAEGVPWHEVEDCAATFAEKMLIGPDGADTSSLQDKPMGWFVTCARNHARNYRLSHQRLARHYAPLSLEAALAVSDSVTSRDHRNHPEERLLRSELWSAVIGAVDMLGPELQGMFVAYYLGGASLVEIAAHTSRTPHGVEQALYRARRRIRSILAERGFLSDGSG